MTRNRYSDRAPLKKRSTRSHSEETRFASDLDRDIAAMKRVCQMVRNGAIRMVGEVGRQY